MRWALFFCEQALCHCGHTPGDHRADPLRGWSESCGDSPMHARRVPAAALCRLTADPLRTKPLPTRNEALYDAISYDHPRTLRTRRTHSAGIATMDRR